MKKTTLEFAAIPEWVFPATPNRLAVFEAFALAGLEGKWVRLDAATQRKLIGYPVFGRQEICVLETGTIKVRRKTCFGMDTEYQEYTATYLWAAAEATKKVSPGTWGKGYYDGPVRNEVY